jgi:hypothetical protein
MGNSCGNLNNGGIAAKQGDWVYFNPGKAIYKEKSDGSERALIIDADASYINVAGDWIYYSRSDDDSRLFKVRTDGTEETILYETMSGDEYVDSLHLVGDWIYFLTGLREEQGPVKIHKIKTDGTGETVISRDSALSMNFVEDWIYYGNGSDGWKIYKMKTDGTAKALVSEESSISMAVYEGWIYYISEHDHRIYKLKLDGTEKVKLSDEGAVALNVSDGWIFYSNARDKNRLYKMKVDGTDKIKIHDDTTFYINIVDDWIYYAPLDKDFYYYEYRTGDGAMFKIKTDGTDRRVTVSDLENIEDKEVTLSIFAEYADALIGEYGKTYECSSHEYGSYTFKIDSFGIQKELADEENLIMMKYEGNGSYALPSIFFFDKDGKWLDITRGFIVSQDTIAFSGYQFNLMDVGKYLVFRDLDPGKNNGKRTVIFEIPNRDVGSSTNLDISAKTNHHAISAGPHHIVGLKKDGTVLAAFRENASAEFYEFAGKFDVSQWKDIVSVSSGCEAYAYNLLTVGLKKDGTVVYADCLENDDNYSITSWTHMKAVEAGGYHIVGLKEDGTVVATGDSSESSVSKWSDIVAISAGSRYTVGLKSDGTVVASGLNDENQCDVSRWMNIVSVSAGMNHTVGLRDDGTVVAVGDNYLDKCEVSSWKDIVAISAGNDQTLGLKKDGTVISTRKSHDYTGWKDIVEISSGQDMAVGLRKDGTVQEINMGDSALSGWKDIGIHDPN